MIRIGGITVTLKNEFSIEQNAIEERAGGNLTVFSSRKERFENYDLVEIEEDNIDIQMLVQSDTVIKYDESRYEHNITLIEPAAKFDAFYPFDRTHSRVPPKNIGQILTIYKTELEKYHNLQIDWDTNASWTNTLIRNKEYEGLSFSVILQDLFREIDARPTVEYQVPNWVITPYFFNNKNNPIAAEDYPNSQIIRQDNLDYATKVKAKLKNAVYQMRDGSYFPSSNGYVLPKSSSPQKIESNLRYELDSSIVQITEAKVINATFKEAGVAGENITIAEVDITPHVVSQEEYSVLPTAAFATAPGIHKKNSVYYQIGSRYIENLYGGGRDEFWIFGENVENLIEAVRESADRDGQVLKINYEYDGTTEDVKLRVKYNKQRDLDILHHRQYLRNMNEATTVHNQSSSFVDVQSKKNNLKAISNRMGNEVREESKVFERSETPYQLGDYKGNFTITKVKNTYRNTTILCEYMLAENFGNINGETSLWREPSPFTRTRKNLTTNLIIEDFVEISREDKDQSTRLTSKGVRNVLATLDPVITHDSPIENGVFRPEMEQANIVASNGVVMPVFTGGGGNITTFHVAFEDTISAGTAFIDSYEDGKFGLEYIYAFEENESGGVKGELKDFRLFFTPNVEYQDDGGYPLIPSLSNYLTNAYTDPNVLDTIDKDVNSRLAVTFNQHFVTDNENVIIGNAWAKYNRLVDDTTLGTTKMYKGLKPFTIYDTEVRDTDTEMSGNWSINVTNRTLTISSSEDADYYALTYDGEILLAFNDGISVGVAEVFYVNFLEKAERIIVNRLEAPSDYQYESFIDSVEISFFNINDEACTIKVTLDGEEQEIQVAATGTTAQEIEDATATFTFTNLTAEVRYEITAQSLPLAGSEKNPSAVGLYSARTLPVPIDLPLVELVDDADTTTSQFKMRYSLPNNIPFTALAFVSVNDGPFEEIGTITAGGSITEIYTEQDLGIQLPPGSKIPVQVYYEYLEIGEETDIQDRVSGYTRPEPPQIDVVELTPYEAVIHLTNTTNTENGFLRLNIDSLGISSNVPVGNFYELALSGLVPDEPYSYPAYFTYAGVLDSATVNISFTTLDGPPAAPSLSRDENNTTPTSIQVRFFNNDTREVIMFGGFAGRQLEQIAVLSGGSNTAKTFSGLKAGAEYTFRAEARESVTQPDGPATELTTYTRPNPPQAQLVGTDKTSATFRLFNGGNDNAVQVYTGSTLIGTIESGDYLEYTRTGLSSSTSYTQTFYNRFEGLDSSNESATYQTLGDPNNPTISVETSTINSITPKITNPNARNAIALGNISGKSLVELGTVSANGSIVGYNYTDEFLEANRSITYRAQLKDAVFPQYESSVVSATLYTAPAKPTNIVVTQATTAGPEIVVVQVDFFNPNDQFGPDLDATLTIFQASSGFQESFTITNITPNFTNTISTGTIQGLNNADFDVTIRLNNPTSFNSDTITYTV